MAANEAALPPFKTHEEQHQWIAEVKTAIGESKTQAERLAKIETLAPQLQAGIDAIRVSQAEAAKHVPSGTDADVVRAYYRPDASGRRGIADIRTKGARMEDGGNHAVGSGGGVVQMLGRTVGVQYRHGLLDDPRPRSEWQVELQRMVTDLSMATAMLQRPNGPANPALAESRREIVEHLRAGPAPIAKVYEDNTGEGGEWIVTLPMAMLERTVELPRVIESQIMDLPITGRSVTIPFMTSGAQPYLHGVRAAGDLNPGQLPKSVPTTSDRTLTAPTLAVSIPLENDAIEDSAAMVGDVLGLMQQLVAEAIIDGREDCMINGDTNATHQDAIASWSPNARWTGLSPSADHRKGFMGFRGRAFDVSAATSYTGSQTVAAYMAGRALLTAPHGVNDLFWITSASHYLAKLVNDSNVLTVDKFGPNATVKTGQLGAIAGSPLFLSDFLTDDLNASGLYDGATTTKTGLLLVAKNRFRIARRRSMRIAVERVERDGITYVVATERAGMVTLDSASVKNCYFFFNLDKS